VSKSVCKNRNKIGKRIRFLIHFAVLLSFFFSCFSPQASVSGQITNPSSTADFVSREYQGQSLVETAYNSGTTYEYEYDPVGNRTAQIVDSMSIAYQYDAADRLTSAGGTAFTWDYNGNLLGDGVYSYAYDAANRLLSANGQGQSYGFGYDGLGNRYQQTVGGQTNTYTLDLAGSLSQVLYDGEFSYYYGLGRISQQQGINSEYFLADALGSVRQIANSNGTLVYRQNFDPFGNLIGSEGDGVSSYGYAGEWTDGTGLQHLRARYYAPANGTFLTRDPFKGVLSQPASLTPYTYALNNPVMYTDPNGEFVDALFDIASISYDVYTIMNKVNLGCSVLWSDWAALGLDALSLAIPFVPAIGGIVFRAALHGNEFIKLARLIDQSSEAILLAKRMEIVRETGRMGENLAGIVKNTKHIESLTHTAKYRIPDQLLQSKYLISEVKNVKKISLTNQIKDYVAYAKSHQFTFEIWVRKTANISKPFQQLIDNGDIVLKFLELK